VKILFLQIDELIRKSS